MPQSFQAPERIGAKEIADAQASSAYDEFIIEPTPVPKSAMDHDGDGKMGGVKGKKPRAKR